MHSPEATIYCANSLCQAPNPESHRFCQQCRSPIPKYYLWAVGNAAKSYPIGALLADRYLCKHKSVFLDTKPGLLPDSPHELAGNIEAYLRLVCFPLHVPQVYSAFSLPEAPQDLLLLLDHAPIILPNGIEQPSTVAWVLPRLDSLWQSGSALRQLNWLWQMAYLWQPMTQESVATSLLHPDLVRVEGGLVRLLELQRDRTTPTLVDLGKQWQTWLGTTHPSILGFLTQLCEEMIQKRLTAADHLVSLLVQAIAHCSATQARRVQFATLTDRGPTRQRNEDACYPPSNTSKTMSMSFGTNAKQGLDSLPMVVVCDGIGGHEGGNIASNLAITTVQQQLHQLPIQIAQQQPATLVAELGKMLHVANDVITQRNDSEQRHERQRMGTTLVMALGCAHELYLAHVGDSRAYRITRQGCHQVTVDDDLASREVRMGYALYRDALQQPNSGSLVQALGMNPSAYLHPTVQRFVMDEDCLFLLCSDGLSDNDRVEENWASLLVPVLEGKLTVAAAAQQLVEIANEHNGHDNVTVGLLYCRVMTTQIVTPPVSAELATIPQPSSPLPDVAIASSTKQSPASTLKTQAVVPPDNPKPMRSPVMPIVLGFLVLLGFTSAIAYFTFPNKPTLNVPALPPTSAISPSPTPLESLPSPASANPSLALRSRVLVNRASVDGQGKTPVVLVANPTNDAVPNAHTVAVGSVLEVVGQQVLANQKWLQLKVCSLSPVGDSSIRESSSREKNRAASPVSSATPSAISSASPPIARSGETGWVPESAIAAVIITDFTPTPAQLGQCSKTNNP
jgi:serine/threonine protein phosphatase PrpC